MEYIYPQAFSGCSKLKSVSIEAETPPFLAENSFSNYDIPLYVPDASVGLYQTTSPWSNFKEVKPLSGTELEKCVTPTISYINGKLKFTCETEGVGFVSEVTVSDTKKYYDAEVPLLGVYHVTAYATKPGYDNSDVATADFVVIGSTVTLVGDVNGDGEVNAVDLTKLIEILLKR